MTIGYNNSIELARSAVLSEVWFGRGFGSEMYDTYNIMYKIEWTESGKYPIFRNLIQYNRFDPEELTVPNWDNLPSSSGDDITPTGWIGEYFSSPDINISKFIFPKFIVEHGYTTAVLFDNTPSASWWLQRSLDPDRWKEAFNSNWRYKISLDRSYRDSSGSGSTKIVQQDFDIDENGNFVVKTDFILQFMTTEDMDTHDGELNLDGTFIKIHNSNYTNPHSTQISGISTQDLDGHIMSTERANQVMTLPNSFMIGSFMVSNDFSFRFMGEQLYLPRPTRIKLNWYKKELDAGYVKVDAPIELKRSDTYYVSAAVYPIQDLTENISRSVARDMRVSYTFTGVVSGTEQSVNASLIPIPYSDCQIENLYQVVIPDITENDDKSYEMTLTFTSFLYDDITLTYEFTSIKNDNSNVGSQGGQNGG